MFERVKKKLCGQWERAAGGEGLGSAAAAALGRVAGTVWSDTARHATSRASRSAHCLRGPQAHLPARLQHLLSRTYQPRSFMQPALRPPWAAPRRALNSIRPTRLAACSPLRPSHHIHNLSQEPSRAPVLLCAEPSRDVPTAASPGQEDWWQGVRGHTLSHREHTQTEERLDASLHATGT